MTFKDILVHQADDTHADERLKFSVSLAAGFEARLTGVYMLDFPVIPGFAAAQLPEEIVQQHYNEIRRRAAQRRDAFDAAAKPAGLSAEFRIMEGDPFDALTLFARTADLVVASQPDPDNPAPQDPVVQSLVLSAGRPVLMVPYAGNYSPLAKRIMVAWNATRESARAVHDALPFLKRAETVIIFSVSSDDQVTDAEIAAHLVAHGVKATARQTIAPDISVGEAILSAIADNSIELLVMGAYGHSRLHELVLGGATREIMEAMTCPVVFSH
ncbi:MAG: universal stress protein [Rhodomicrobiaceae bacterium]